MTSHHGDCQSHDMTGKCSEREISLRHLPTFQVPATIADKLLGVVSSYITVHFYKYAEKHQRVVQKITCTTLN